MTKFECILFGVLLVTQMAVGAVVDRPSAKSNSVEYQNVTLIGPTDPSFDSILDASFPRLRSISGFEEVRPFLALICNRGTHRVHAYSVVWSISDVNSRTTRANNVQMKEPSGRTAISGQRPILLPGEIHLVSPELSVTPTEYARDPGIVGVLKITSRRNVPKAGMHSVQAKLDGIVFDDATYFGENNERLFEHFVLERNAQHDEGVSVMRLVNQGKSDADIRNVLLYHIDKGRTLQSDDAAYFDIARARQAKRFLGILDNEGRDRMMALASHLARYPAMRLTKRTQ